MALPGLIDTLLHSCQLEGTYYDCPWHDDDDDDDELFLWYGWPTKGISSRDHFQRSSPWRICDKPWVGFEPAQNLNSGLVEWNYEVVITTTPTRHHGATWRTENTTADLNSGIAFIILFSQKKSLRWKEIHTHTHTSHTHTHTHAHTHTHTPEMKHALETSLKWRYEY